MAGGQLFGFLGVLLALPVAAVLVVVLRYAHARYTASQLYGADEAEPPVGGPSGPNEAGEEASGLKALLKDPESRDAP
jgi:hypothetical protein